MWIDWMNVVMRMRDQSRGKRIGPKEGVRTHQWAIFLEELVNCLEDNSNSLEWWWYDFSKWIASPGASLERTTVIWL